MFTSQPVAHASHPQTNALSRLSEATRCATIAQRDEPTQVRPDLTQTTVEYFKAICRVLDLAEPTVKFHVSAILKALKVANRTEAVIAATNLDLVRQDARQTTWPVLFARILSPLKRGEIQRVRLLFCLRMEPLSLGVSTKQKSGQCLQRSMEGRRCFSRGWHWQRWTRRLLGWRCRSGSRRLLREGCCSC
jgi:hypothetical protein